MESKLSNLFVNRKGQRFDYIPAKGMSGRENYPFRTSRRSHAEKLEADFAAAWGKAKQNQEDIGTVSVSSRNGVYLEILGQSGFDLISKSLEHTSQHVRICNIKQEEDGENKKIVKTTVYVPDNKRDFFIKKINRYKETESGEKVIGTIESINLALVDALWMSDKTKMPTTVPKWCEAWLMYEKEETVSEVADTFFKICEDRNIEYKDQRLVFPERVVLGVRANRQQLADLQWLSSRIAEYRMMETPTGFYTHPEFLEFCT